MSGAYLYIGNCIFKIMPVTEFLHKIKSEILKKDQSNCLRAVSIFIDPSKTEINSFFLL